ARGGVGDLRRPFVQTQIDVRAPLDDLSHELKARDPAEPDRRGFADVAGIRLSHPGERVEWCESRAPIVRIGASVDQHDRELEMTVLYREQQRARALADRLVRGGASGPALAALQRRVHVDTRLQKRARHAAAPFTPGKEHWCGSGIV